MKGGWKKRLLMVVSVLMIIGVTVLLGGIFRTISTEEGRIAYAREAAKIIRPLDPVARESSTCFIPRKNIAFLNCVTKISILHLLCFLKDNTDAR